MLQWILLFLSFMSISKEAETVSIVFLGVETDVVDFSALGKEGFWFAGFGCSAYSFEKPTNFSEYDGLHSWAGPLKHIERSD